MYKKETTSNKIALSFDLEDWYHYPSITGASFSKYKTIEDFFDTWNEDYDYITDMADEILGLLKRFDLKATFFVVADLVKTHPLLVKIIGESEHEVACHGMHHYRILDKKTNRLLISMNEWKRQTKDAKDMLEKSFGKEVIGFRAPAANITDWMLGALEDIGFKYDSSLALNSLYNRTNLKLNNIPSWPYRINCKDFSNRNPDSKIIELPWSNYKIGNLCLPGGGGFFFRLFGYHYFKAVINQKLNYGDTMFYLHPLDLSDKKIPFNNFLHRPFFHVNKGRTSKRRFTKLLDTFQNKFTTCYEIYKRNR